MTGKVQHQNYVDDLKLTISLFQVRTSLYLYLSVPHVSFVNKRSAPLVIVDDLLLLTYRYRKSLQPIHHALPFLRYIYTKVLP